VVHHQLVRWLERLGHRTDLAAAAPDQLTQAGTGSD